MRLVTVLPPAAPTVAGAPWTGPRVGVLLESGAVLPLGALADVAPSRLPDEIDRLDLVALLALDPDFGGIRDALEIADPEALAAAAMPRGWIRLAPPVLRPSKVVGVGYNYLEHVTEQGMERPERPQLFAKFASSLVADCQPIVRPAGTHALDLEAELAVVIGRRAVRVRAADGLSHVAGYTVGNDVTARNWQGQKAALRPGEKGDGQWLRAKGSDTFCPLGPALVTTDEVGDGRGRSVRSWRTAAAGAHADEPFLMQNGNTRDLLNGIAELVALISAEVALEPGDVILTGTPSGVGVFRDPPVFLEPGDLVRVEVEGIGTLTNPIADADGRVPEGSPGAQFLAELRQELSSGAPEGGQRQ